MHQKETNQGQTISGYVQGTSKIWKSAEGQKTGEEPVNKCMCTACGQGETKEVWSAQRAYL
jgi:hypothetical protein